MWHSPWSNCRPGIHFLRYRNGASGAQLHTHVGALPGAVAAYYAVIRPTCRGAMTPALTMRLVQRVPRTSELPRSLVGRHLAITRLGLACGSASLGLACGITSLSTHLLVDTLRSHAWDLLVAAPAWDLLVASPASTRTCWSRLCDHALMIYYILHVCLCSSLAATPCGSCSPGLRRTLMLRTFA